MKLKITFKIRLFGSKLKAKLIPKAKIRITDLPNSTTRGFSVLLRNYYKWYLNFSTATSCYVKETFSNVKKAIQ